jgi:hypothetical protein
MPTMRGCRAEFIDILSRTDCPVRSNGIGDLGCGGDPRGELAGRPPWRRSGSAGDHGRLRPVPAVGRTRRNCPRPAEDGRDERLARMDLRATVVPGLVLITVLMAAWLVEIARGNSGCR